MKNKMINLKKTSWIFIALIPVAFYLVISSCETTKTSKSDVKLGEELYISYCQMCHGKNGDGTMADMLKVPPPDLTRISERRNGVFPDEGIYKIIDGQEALKSGHGDRDMPIWGVALGESEGVDNVMVPKKIYQLIEYLKTIQK